MSKGLLRTIALCIGCIMLLASCSPAASPTPSSGAQGTAPTSSTAVTDGPVDDGEPKVTPPGELPVYTGGKVTFSVFNMIDDKDWSYETNSFTKYITDLTGVHLDWTVVTVNPSEKLNLMMASNERPELVFYHQLTPEVQMHYGQQGLFIPIEDLLLEHGYFFQQNVLPYRPETLNAYRMPDGNIYCVPKVMGAFEEMYAQCMIINQSWLDNLGLAMPTTTAEFKDALMAFKTGDPNGNGKADEIPLLGYKNSGAPGSVWGFLMFPFIYHDGANSMLINRDGNDVFPAFTQDGWKEGIEYMADLYANGLIDPQSFTLTSNDPVRQLSEQEEVLVGAYATKGRQNVINPTKEMVFDYEYVPPLEGPSGVRRHMYNPDGKSVGDAFFSVAITDVCKYPEIAIRFFDAFYDQDVSISSGNGVKDEDWRYAQPGEVTATGEPATIVILNTVMNTQNNKGWENAGPCLIPWSIRYGAAVDPDNAGKFDPSAAMYKGAKEIYAPFAEEESHFYNNLQVLPADLEEAVQLKTDIYTYVTQSLAQFITGERDVNKDWDAYLKELDSYGLERWMQLQIDAAQRQYGETLTYRK